MNERDDLPRTVLPIPDRPRTGLITYDAKDPETKFPDGHRSIALALNSAGVSLKGQGMLDKALPYYERALEMRQRLFPAWKNVRRRPSCRPMPK